MHIRFTVSIVSSLLLLGASSACKPDPPPLEEPSVWSELAATVEGGVLLSAANVGDELVLVGGELASEPGVNPGGPGYLVRYRDGVLCREADVNEHTLWWIDAPSAEQWYAVGEAGTIIHDQNGTRTDESVATNAVLYGVFDQGDRVIAVGGDVWSTDLGEVWQRDSSGQWTALAQDLPGVVFKVWDRWLVGIGVAWTLEGNTLVEHFPPNGERLLTVHGNTPDDVWAVGGLQQPVMLHWVDDAWESVDVDPYCASGGLNGVWISPNDEVWIAGFFGGFGVYRDGEWECPDPKPTREHFHAIRGHENSVLLMGGDLFSPGDNYGTVFHYGSPDVTEMSAEIGPCD
jgi:hypothetical protein